MCEHLRDIVLSGDFLFVEEIPMSKTLKDNLSFILICLLIFAAILAVAYILEKLLVKDRKKLGSTHFISYTAIFSAMACFLMFLEIPLFFAP